MKDINVRKILYTPPRGIGDIMFSLPLLHSLRNAYPRAQIYVPIPKDKKNVIELVGFLEQTPRYLPKPGEDNLAMERWQASVRCDTKEKYRLERLIYEKYLYGEDYDLALIPKDFKIRAIDCPIQVNEEDLRRRGIKTNDVHMVDRFLGFTDYLEIKKFLCFELGIGKDKEISLNSRWKIESGNPYVVLNLGASLGRKIWSDQGYKDTALWCLNNGFNVVLVGDKDCFNRALDIQGADGRIFNTVLREGYSFNLENLARLASRASIVISPDTGILHVADAAGAKVIGLFGPTSPLKYAPYNNRNNVISRYNSDQNVQNISSKEVIKKLKEVTKR